MIILISVSKDSVSIVIGAGIWIHIAVKPISAEPKPNLHGKKGLSLILTPPPLELSGHLFFGFFF